MNRFSTLAVLGALALGACSPGAKTAAAGGDKYAGLDEAIKGWHASIKTTEAACKAKPDGKGCQGFEVACKGERELAAADQAKGISAKIVVAMSWEGWDAVRSEYRSSSGFAEFNKIDGTWTRTDAGPVNLSTCVSA